MYLKSTFEITNMSMSSLAMNKIVAQPCILLILEMIQVSVLPERKEEVTNLVQSHTRLFNKYFLPFFTKISHVHHWYVWW